MISNIFFGKCSENHSHNFFKEHVPNLIFWIMALSTDLSNICFHNCIQKIKLEKLFGNWLLKMIFQASFLKNVMAWCHVVTWCHDVDCWLVVVGSCWSLLAVVGRCWPLLSVVGRWWVGSGGGGWCRSLGGGGGCWWLVAVCGGSRAGLGSVGRGEAMVVGVYRTCW